MLFSYCCVFAKHFFPGFIQYIIVSSAAQKALWIIAVLFCRSTKPALTRWLLLHGHVAAVPAWSRGAPCARLWIWQPQEKSGDEKKRGKTTPCTVLSREGNGVADKWGVPDLNPSKDTRNPSQQSRRLSTRQVHNPGAEERAH